MIPLLGKTSLLFISWIAQFILKTQLKYYFFSDFPDLPKQVDQSHLWVPHSIWLITVRVLTTRDCCFSIYVCLSWWIEQRSIINICSVDEWMNLLPFDLPGPSTVPPHLFTCSLLMMLFKIFKEEFIFLKQLCKQLPNVTNRIFPWIGLFRGHLEKYGIWWFTIYGV